MIGATDENGAYTLTQLLSGSSPFGLFAAQDEAGNRFLATTTLRQTQRYAELLQKLVFDVEGIAPLSHIGPLHTTQATGLDLMIEQMPTGTPSNLAGKAISDPATVARMGVALAGILERLHAQQSVLLSLRPQSVYIANDSERGIQLMGVAPRAERFYFSAEKPDVYTPLAFDDTFVAPEVWLGGEPGNAADLFSLCGILAYWLSGRSPFGGKGYMGQVKAIMRNKRAYHLPGDRLGQLLEGGLESQAANRPNLSELRQSLQTIADIINPATK